MVTKPQRQDSSRAREDKLLSCPYPRSLTGGGGGKWGQSGFLSQDQSGGREKRRLSSCSMPFPPSSPWSPLNCHASLTFSLSLPVFHFPSSTLSLSITRQKPGLLSQRTIVSPEMRSILNSLLLSVASRSKYSPSGLSVASYTAGVLLALTDV